MATIFVVMGTTGEYSDRSEWMVRAYASQADAEACRDRCNTYADNAPEHSLEEGRYQARRAYAAANPDDTGMSLDYTGTEYSVTEVEFVP